MIRPYFFSEHSPLGTYAMLVSDLMATDPIQVGEWQAMDVSKSDLHKTHELEDVSLCWERVPGELGHIRQMIPYVDGAWAIEHFQERVSGLPHNPAPSHVRWPYAVRGNADHTKPTASGYPAQRESSRINTSAAGYVVTQRDQFDHTYPERFWPKHAGHDHAYNVAVEPAYEIDALCGGTPGIRFNYGDLNDVVALLARSPLTRQAYLPVWFPEDTGAVEGQRVPCTLGYHFMQRGGRLSVRYYLRSCDVYRHLSNDVFFAAALLNWVCDGVYEMTQESETPIHFRPGSLTMHISSLHAFAGDREKIEKRLVDL
jgi:hypothetical protein